MLNLIVLLPSSDVLGPAGWDATPLPFSLLGRNGEALQTGQALFDSLPQGDATVLVVAARDTLLLNAKLPPVGGPRLQRVLPNVVEEHLIRDSQGCHIAIDPSPLDSDERCLAVVDREWFAAVLDRFSRAGHRRLRAVPLIHCIPLQEEGFPQRAGEVLTELTAEESGAGPVGDTPENGPDDVSAALSDAVASVLIVRRDRLDEAMADHGDWIELAIRQGALGFGMSVNATKLDVTLAELAQRQPLVVYSLQTEPASGPRREPGAGADDEATPRADGVLHPKGRGVVWVERRLAFATVATAALACRFDLCQFDLAHAGRNRPGVEGLKPWRVALGFVGASLLVSIVALNVQWFELRHRRDALNAQMTALVKSAFPETTVVLDPHAQMASQLARLAQRTGELRGDDFLVLTAELARALGPIPSASLAELNYSEGAVEVTFKTGTEIDEDGLKRRLAANGLSVQEDNGKWLLKSAQSRPQ